jgi:hypothetical protein
VCARRVFPTGAEVALQGLGVRGPRTVAPLFQEGRGARGSASEGSTFRGSRSAQKGKPSVRCSGAACGKACPQLRSWHAKAALEGSKARLQLTEETAAWIYSEVPPAAAPGRAASRRAGCRCASGRRRPGRGVSRRPPRAPAAPRAAPAAAWCGHLRRVEGIACKSVGGPEAHLMLCTCSRMLLNTGHCICTTSS